MTRMPFPSPLRAGVGRHEDEDHQPPRPAIQHPVLHASRRYRRLHRAELRLLPPDRETDSALEDEIHLVFALVDMPLLDLARLEAVEVAEEPPGLEEAHLFHLVSCEGPQGRHALHLHPAPPQPATIRCAATAPPPGPTIVAAVKASASFRRPQWPPGRPGGAKMTSRRRRVCSVTAVRAASAEGLPKGPPAPGRREFPSPP